MVSVFGCNICVVRQKLGKYSKLFPVSIIVSLSMLNQRTLFSVRVSVPLVCCFVTLCIVYNI